MTGPSGNPHTSLRHLLDSLDAIVWEAEAGTWKITFVNAAAERILGYPVPRWLSEPDFWVSHIHPDDRERTVARCQESVDKRRDIQLEYRMLAADGRVVWIHDAIHVVRDADPDPPLLYGVMMDITAQKALETELRISEERFARFSDASVDGVVVHSNGRILDANRTIASMLGYSVDDMLTMTPADLTIPEERAILAAHIRSGAETPLIGHALRKDGLAIPVEIRARSVCSTEIPTRVVVIRDITEQQRVESQIRAGEARLRVLLEQIPAVVWTTDRSVRIDSVVGRGMSVLGASGAELLGRDLRAEAGANRDARAVFTAHEQALAGGAASYFTTLNGVRWQAHVQPLLGDGGAIRGVIGIAIDVSETDRLAGALSESEERYRALVDALPDGVAVHVDGQFVFVNPAGVRLLGAKSAESLMGRSILDFIHPDTLPKAMEQLSALREARLPVLDSRYRLLRCDGTSVEVELSATALEYNGRAAVQVVCRDISERLVAEATLRDAERRLRESQKIEAVGRLAGGIAHDFNNLLTVISSFTQMALDGLSPQAPQHADLVEVQHAAGRAAELTRQLLAFSRNQVMQPVVLDVNVVVRQVERMLRRIIGPGIELRTELMNQPAVIRADAGQLEQVLMNLVINARDAMPDGGVITVRTALETVGERDARSMAGRPEIRPGAYVRLDVADTGHGMTDKVRGRLFEPFFTTKPVGEGTGLGLAVVYGIMRQSDGWVAVDSTPGSGTTFHLYMPVTQEPLDVSRGTSPHAPVGRGVETILVAEDEPALRTVIRRILEREGYRVLLAENGNAALRIASDAGDEIALLLTDLVMPGMNGRDLAARFAAAHPKAQILLMSGYADDASLRAESDHELINKPFTATDLVATVRRTLDMVGRA